MKRGERLRGREISETRIRCVAPVAHLFYCCGLCWALWLGSAFGTSPLWAQTDFETWFEAWVERQATSGLGEDGDDLAGEELEARWTHFRRLWDVGLDLSRASRSELEDSGLLSPFQCESLWAYRQEYGGLSSLQELAWVDGFSASWIEEHRPFLRVAETGAPGDRPSSSGMRHELQLRARYDVEPSVEGSGIPVGGSLKYQAAGGPWELGLILEQDVEEPRFPDYAAGYLAAEPYLMGHRAKVVLGSYQLRLGQGLVVWKGFSVGAAGSPSQLLRRGETVVPYRSTDEVNGLTGIALTLGPKRWMWTVALSSRRVDARVDDTFFYSLPSDGYHRTPTEQARRKTMWHHLGGVSTTFRQDRWQVGAQVLLCGYNKRDGRQFRDYRARTAFQGLWANASVDVRAAWSAMQVYGECAVDRRGAVALLTGWEWAPSYPWELALQLRYYQPDYTAPHAGAWASGTAVSNEHSATAQVLWRWGSAGSLAVSGLWVHYPASRYGVKQPSQAHKLRVQLGWNGDFWQCQARWQWTHDPHRSRPRQQGQVQTAWSIPLAGSLQGRSHPGFGKIFVKVQASVVCSQASASTTIGAGAAAAWGRAASVQTGWKNGRWEISAQGTAYHADAWEDRVYLYQRSLPGSFSFPALYGRGVQASLYLQYKPRRGLALTGVWNRTGLSLLCKWGFP